MAKCSVCGGETFFIRHIEGGDHFRIICTECDTLVGHLHVNNIPMVEMTTSEIESDCVELCSYDDE